MAASGADEEANLAKREQRERLERWECVAEILQRERGFVQVLLSTSCADLDDPIPGLCLETPGLGVGCRVAGDRGADRIPQLALAVGSGWLLKDTSHGPMRMEIFEDVSRSGQLYAEVGVWFDGLGDMAFFRRPEGSCAWDCSGAFSAPEVNQKSGVLVFARRAGGAAFESPCATVSLRAIDDILGIVRSSHPPSAPKLRMQVHWKGSSPTPWYDCAIRGRDLKSLASGLRDGSSPSVCDAHLEGPLHHCARRIWVEGLGVLLEARAEVDAISVFRRTPLLELASLGGDNSHSFEIVAKAASLLLDSRADVNYQGGQNWVQHACELQKVLQHRTALHHAAESAQLPLLVQLLAAGALCDVLDASGRTPLGLAIVGEVCNDAVRRCNVVSCLLKAHANPNPPIDPRWRIDVTPLHAAARNGYFEIANILLQSRALPDYGDHSVGVLTPLMLAARGKSSYHTALVVQLLDARASIAPSSHNHQAKSALELARLNKAPAATLQALEGAALVQSPKNCQLEAYECQLDLPLLRVETEQGPFYMRLRSDVAPLTVAHILELVSDGVYRGCCFYRSDIVLQFGLRRADGSRVPTARPSLAFNETARFAVVSNLRGTVALAHRDVPDCGHSDIFINLKANRHLDVAGGGYCVFAEVLEEDLAVVEALATAVLEGRRPALIDVSTVRR